MKSEFNDLKLLIVGNNETSYGQKLITDTIDDKSIVFINKAMDVRPYLQFSELFVIPTNSVWEGQPMAPVEAMSMSNVVLGSNISGISEVLSSFPELLFTPGDSKELYSKIKFFLNQPLNEREDLRKGMRREVLKRFAMNDFIERHENVYKELLNK
jgi:glycosyltransferase involved in cell wall biosynthesis